MEIPVVFHNGLDYYHFVIKELAKWFKEQIECFAKNTEKYKPFFVSIEKEVTKVDKDGNESIITTSYKKTIDTSRFMRSSLSNLVDNFGEAIHKIKCKDCVRFLENKSASDNLLNYKCLSCNKNYSNKNDEELKNWLKKTFKFSIVNNINKFILLSRKIFYPYEIMNDWLKVW